MRIPRGEKSIAKQRNLSTLNQTFPVTDAMLLYIIQQCKWYERASQFNWCRPAVTPWGLKWLHVVIVYIYIVSRDLPHAEHTITDCLLRSITVPVFNLMLSLVADFIGLNRLLSASYNGRSDIDIEQHIALRYISLTIRTCYVPTNPLRW